MKKAMILVIVIMLLLATTVVAFADAPKNGAEYCKGLTDGNPGFSDCMKAPAHMCWDKPWTNIFKNHGSCVKFFMSDLYK